MGQRGGANFCNDCAFWKGFVLPRDHSVKFGLCLRDNIGCRANIATPLIVTAAVDLCVNFVARNAAQESAGSPGGLGDPALVICAGGAAR